MSADTKYNGWTNYETWNVKLWIDNDQGSQEYWQEKAEQAYTDADACEVLTRKEQAAYDLAAMLKTEFEESNPLADQASMWADLLNAALSSVNWDEIAANMLEDVENEAKEDEDA